MAKKPAVEFWRGQMLEIHTEDKSIYNTQLIKSDVHLQVKKPMSNRNIPLLIRGKIPVKVCFYDQGNLGGHSFKSNIFINKDDQIILEKPVQDAIVEVQRRNYFRVQAGTELHLGVPSVKDPKKLEHVELYTQDLSGGGLSFLNLKKLVQKDDEVTGILHLQIEGVKKEIEFIAIVVGVRETADKVFRTSLEFKEMKEFVRSDIIKYCMAKQMEAVRLRRN